MTDVEPQAEQLVSQLSSEFEQALDEHLRVKNLLAAIYDEAAEKPREDQSVISKELKNARKKLLEIHATLQTLLVNPVDQFMFALYFCHGIKGEADLVLPPLPYESDEDADETTEDFDDTIVDADPEQRYKLSKEALEKAYCGCLIAHIMAFCAVSTYLYGFANAMITSVNLESFYTFWEKIKNTDLNGPEIKKKLADAHRMDESIQLKLGPYLSGLMARSTRELEEILHECKQVNNEITDIWHTLNQYFDQLQEWHKEQQQPKVINNHRNTIAIWAIVVPVILAITTLWCTQGQKIKRWMDKSFKSPHTHQYQQKDIRKGLREE